MTIIRAFKRPSNFQPVEGEKWAQIGENYEISDHGRVRTLRESKKYAKGDILKTCKIYTDNRKDYHLYASIDGKLTPVHRLVAKHFLGVEDKPVRHIDGNRHNNHVSNLAYSTKSACMAHAYRTGHINKRKQHDRIRKEIQG
jgi:hypothetical protein